jgi:RIO kinase 1
MNEDEEFNPGFNGTYQEHLWIKESLGGFYEDRWFTEVLYRVKAGKEATVYCCRAHPSTGLELLAAKVYRPRMFRAMRNDWIYRQGRDILGADGTAVRDRRSLRAVARRTRYGRRLGVTSWSQYEYNALQDFHAAGADVPRPLAHAGNAILMEYVGDATLAAPILQRISLDPGQARPLFDRLMGNVELFLACDRNHADLSAHNVLYWQGQVRIIDFPQVVDPWTNPSALSLLARDVERLCQYFARQGVQSDAGGIVSGLWRRFMKRQL